MGIMSFFAQHKGQMTVEFVALFPAMLVIALLATNALLFLSECASFDRVFRNAVCTYAPSPGYQKGTDQSVASVQAALDASFDQEYFDCSVTASGQSDGLYTFEGILTFHPTLFGSGSLGSVFGVSFPVITHSNTLSVDVYKPGVFF